MLLAVGRWPPSPRCLTSIKKRSLLSGGGSTPASTTKATKIQKEGEKGQGDSRQGRGDGVWGFDAKMFAVWMKSMRMMYGKEKKANGKSGAAPPILTSRQ